MSEKWNSTAVASYRMDINQIEQDIRNLSRELAAKQVEVKLLKLHMQANCDHSWAAPILGHEEEGRNCHHCGINDHMAATVMKRWEEAEAEEQLRSNCPPVARPEKTRVVDPNPTSLWAAQQNKS